MCLLEMNCLHSYGFLLYRKMTFQIPISYDLLKLLFQASFNTKSLQLKPRHNGWFEYRLKSQSSKSCRWASPATNVLDWNGLQLLNCFQVLTIFFSKVC